MAANRSPEVPLEDVEMTVTDSKAISPLRRTFSDLIRVRHWKMMKTGFLKRIMRLYMVEVADTDCLVMRVSKEEKGCLRKPWRRTLIIRLLGRSIHGSKSIDH